jgi:hypothetical protein
MIGGWEMTGARCVMRVLGRAGSLPLQVRLELALSWHALDPKSLVSRLVLDLDVDGSQPELLKVSTKYDSIGLMTLTFMKQVRINISLSAQPRNPPPHPYPKPSEHIWPIRSFSAVVSTAASTQRMHPLLLFGRH